ncbi:MAG: hypothetical protein O0X93_03850 [Methanocorpusculum sp.]|nr:hypothetical protein [Methanocorpusculum sp.]
MGLFYTTALAAEEPNEAADTGEAIVQSQEVAEPAPAAEDEAVPAVDVTATEEAAETDGITVSEGVTVNQGDATINYTVPADVANATITISGAVTLTGTGDAFTINADTELVFEEGASLTLSGYTNGFVVADAAVTSANMEITAATQMDVFRLKTDGQLELSGSSTITGSEKDGPTNRALVLESGEGQAITLAENTTLTATNFYRGLETGGAKHYTISGAGMDSSTFNFQNNTVGMALSYFDEDANYENCKLDVSNCDENGIFMRQANAAIWGLYFDSENIHCVNTNPTSGIAIRFHTGPFRFDNSVMTIDGSTTTGLWIYDGWDATRTGSGISNSTITVKNVEGNVLQYNGKAITMAICHDWTIDGSTINVDNCGYAGINLSNDTRVSGSIIGGYTAVPGMVGGKLIITDSDIHSSNMLEINPSARSASALFTVQVGQFLEFGDDVTAYSDNDSLPIVMCAKGTDPYPHFAGGFLPTSVEYDLSDLAANLNTDLRFIMTGGSSKDLATHEYAVARNKPVDEDGTVLSMVTLTEEQYNNLKNTDGTLTITVGGESNTYHVSRAADDGNRYIWVPDGAVIGGGV